MFSLIKKEVFSFFSHASGTIIIISFLVANGALLWLLSNDFNIIESGYAQLDGLFSLSPFLMIIFIPALTMRLFSDEYKDGTIEILKTLPISSNQLVLSKYISGLIIVSLAILPTIAYLVSIYYLADPIGNIDMAGSIGSYIGLFLLSALFVAIGTYASSTTSNQIVSFLVALLMCSFFYFGFDIIAREIQTGTVQLIIENIGSDYHYRSLSKGVIDSRNLVYFISLIVVFLQLTVFSINKK